MKKSLIAAAGVSAFAAVAMPMAGVFADTMTITDNLSVTVNASCTMATSDGSSTTVTGNSYSGTGNPGELVVLGTTGTASPTNITIKCNANNGYTLTPTFSALTNGTAAHNIAYSGSPEASAGSKTWTAYYSKNSGTATAFTTAAISSGSTMTDTYEFSYKVGLDNNQATGTYNGTAQYVLAAAS
ncbi:hypothetical protein IJG04_00560 [Candidatus Saccharibacteria bacterium]|nr:hypothetical protein [Candidatus Saccharibacteria bacterium]